MDNDSDVKLSAGQKKLLEEIRKENVDRFISTGHASDSVGKIQYAHDGSEGSDSRDQDATLRVGRGEESSSSVVRTKQGNDSRSGQIVSEDEYSTQSNDSSSNRLQGSDGINERDKNAFAQDDKERKLELQRLRAKRYRERQNQAQNAGVTSLSANAESLDEKSLTTNAQNETNDSRFQLKNPFKKPDVTEVEPNKNSVRKDKEIKLFTDKEVKEQVENLAYVYQHGSGLLDDILEIVVKGHEDVQIWQLDEEDALMLANMHLQKAKVDKASAQSARKLIEIKDKMFVLMMMTPRLVATGKHIVSNGISFK